MWGVAKNVGQIWAVFGKTTRVDMKKPRAGGGP